MADVFEVISLLKEKNLKIATAESCTGGMIASTIVDVPGVSAFFDEGYVTYANEAKHKNLFVDWDILNQYGAVSEECAYAMAQGLYRQTRADVCICSTGIAGPDGGTPEKPVGLVYLSCKYKDKVTVEKCNFSGSRTEIRKAAVDRAFEFILECMNN